VLVDVMGKLEVLENGLPHIPSETVMIGHVENDPPIPAAVAVIVTCFGPSDSASSTMVMSKMPWVCPARIVAIIHLRQSRRWMIWGRAMSPTRAPLIGVALSAVL
jgi:hypothetical protein